MAFISCFPHCSTWFHGSTTVTDCIFPRGCGSTGLRLAKANLEEGNWQACLEQVQELQEGGDGEKIGTFGKVNSKIVKKKQKHGGFMNSD